MISFIPMALPLLSCTTDKIKDSEWTGSRGPLGAVSFHFLTSEKHVLAPAEWLAKWNDLKHPMVCTTTDTFADIKALWENCVTKGQCEFVPPEQQQKAGQFFSNVEKLKGN